MPKHKKGYDTKSSPPVLESKHPDSHNPVTHEPRQTIRDPTHNLYRMEPVDSSLSAPLRNPNIPV